MHCGGRGMINSTPVMERKQAPEPPQRHCSTMLASGATTTSTEHITDHMDAITLSSQHHQLYQHPKSYNSPQHQYQQQQQQQYMHQQMHPQYMAAANMAHHNQPIYANFNVVTQHHMQQQQHPPTHMQTTVEVHVEKPPPSVNDSKVI